MDDTAVITVEHDSGVVLSNPKSLSEDNKDYSEQIEWRRIQGSWTVKGSTGNSIQWFKRFPCLYYDVATDSALCHYCIIIKPLPGVL